MGAISTILAATGLAITAAGTAASVMEQQKSGKLQKQSIEVQKNQMELEAGRSRRQVYRDMVKAQATSEASAAAQGGLASSSLEGGLAQAANSGQQGTRDINQNTENARQMFNLKSASIGIGQTSSMLYGVGKGLTGLGGMFSGPNTNKPPVN